MFPSITSEDNAAEVMTLLDSWKSRFDASPLALMATRTSSAWVRVAQRSSSEQVSVPFLTRNEFRESEYMTNLRLIIRLAAWESNAQRDPAYRECSTVLMTCGSERLRTGQREKSHLSE